MHDRHLRPDEFELLLDGEEGFGVTPLRAHVRRCASCAAEFEHAGQLMATLDALPDFATSAAFSDRVMSQVQVFEPWHAAALASARRFMPASRPARVAASVGAALSAGILTAAAAWAVARADIALLLAQMGLETFRDQVGAAGSDIVTTVLGPHSLDALLQGSPEFAAVVVGGFVAVVGLGVVGLRAMAGAARSIR